MKLTQTALRGDPTIRINRAKGEIPVGSGWEHVGKKQNLRENEGMRFLV